MVFFLRTALKDQVDAAVKQLLALKAEYKQQTGKDYKPGQAPACPVQTQSSSPSTESSSSPQVKELFSQVSQQGEVVRKLKSEKAPKVRNQSQSGINKLIQLVFERTDNNCSFISGWGRQSSEDSIGPEEQVQDSYWRGVQTSGCCWTYWRGG